MIALVALWGIGAVALGWARERRSRASEREFAADWILELKANREIADAEAHEWAMRAGALTRWIEQQGATPPSVVIERHANGRSLRVLCGCAEHEAQRIAGDPFPHPTARA